MAFVAEIIPQEDFPKFIDNPVWDKLSYGRGQITPGFSRWVVDRKREMFVIRSSGDRTTNVFTFYVKGEYVQFRTFMRLVESDKSKPHTYFAVWYVYDLIVPSNLEMLTSDILQLIEEFCHAAGDSGSNNPKHITYLSVQFNKPPFELIIY